MSCIQALCKLQGRICAVSPDAAGPCGSRKSAEEHAGSGGGGVGDDVQAIVCSLHVVQDESGGPRGGAEACTAKTELRPFPYSHEGPARLVAPAGGFWGLIREKGLSFWLCCFAGEAISLN